MASNSDKIDEFFADVESEVPEERSFTIGGKSKTVWVRQLSQGERIRINKGIKFHFAGKAGAPGGTTTTSDTDLGESGERDALLVQFSICRSADGTRMFDNLEQVKKRKGPVFDALLKIASDYNNAKGGDEEAGKGSTTSPSSAAQ